MSAALEVLANQTQNKLLAEATRKIFDNVQSGKPLAESLAKHPRIFSGFYVSMVAAGEAAGKLDVVLGRLAGYLEKSDTLRRKIQGALVYPAVLGAVSGTAIVLLLTLVVPRFAEMFLDLGGNLPAITQTVMSFSVWIQKYGIVLAPGAVAGWFVFGRISRSDKGGILVDSIKLRLPLSGDLTKKSAISRFCETLATLLSSGVAILDAWTITAKTAGNKVVEKSLLQVLAGISSGQGIAEKLKETKLFPDMVVQMIAVGEKTADLPGMLGRIASFYSEEVDGAVEGFASVLEPLMIAIMGLVIGTILVALYMPMFEMINTIA
jgi:type IV pilus assembly protein PilC